MTINTRKRLAVLGTAGLIALTTAVGGASTAQASSVPYTNSSFSFVAPQAENNWPITVYGSEIKNIGTLQLSDFSYFLACDDGLVVPVTGYIISSDDALAFNGNLPASEAGHSCTMTVSVDKPQSSIGFKDEGAFIAQPPNVHFSGTMVTVVGSGRGHQY